MILYPLSQHHHHLRRVADGDLLQIVYANDWVGEDIGFHEANDMARDFANEEVAKLRRSPLAEGYCIDIGRPWEIEKGGWYIEPFLTETGTKALAALDEGLGWNTEHAEVDLDETRRWYHRNVLSGRLSLRDRALLKMLRHPALQDVLDDGMVKFITEGATE